MSLPYQLFTDEIQNHTDSKGFTLLELMVVLVLLSIMMAVTVPRFRVSIITDPLKQSARRIIGTVKEARLRAAASPMGCGLVVHVEEGTFGLFCPQADTPNIPERADDGDFDDADDTEDESSEPEQLLSLAEPVRIKSVWDGDSTRYTIGEVILWINHDGLMEPSVINLSEGGDELGLTISPFLQEITVADEAVVPVDHGGSEVLL